MRNVDQNLPYRQKHKQLPRIAGTQAVDLAPLAPASPLLSAAPLRFAPNINTGRQSFASQSVAERLESRAAKIQKPMVARHQTVIETVMKERKERVHNDMGKAVEVNLNGTRFSIDPGNTEQPHSVAVAFQERRNALLRHAQIMNVSNYERMRDSRDIPDTEDMRDEIEYRAMQDITP